jgi:hypothetical protein
MPGQDALLEAIQGIETRVIQKHEYQFFPALPPIVIRQLSSDKNSLILEKTKMRHQVQDGMMATSDIRLFSATSCPFSIVLADAIV